MEKGELPLEFQNDIFDENFLTLLSVLTFFDIFLQFLAVFTVFDSCYCLAVLAHQDRMLLTPY